MSNYSLYHTRRPNTRKPQASITPDINHNIIGHSSVGVVLYAEEAASAVWHGIPRSISLADWTHYAMRSSCWSPHNGASVHAYVKGQPGQNPPPPVHCPHPDPPLDPGDEQVNYSTSLHSADARHHTGTDCLALTSSDSCL